MSILVLYEELAWYFINCLNETADRYNARILVVCKSPHFTAPFRFPFLHPSIEILYRENFSEDELQDKIKRFGPQGIFLAGWTNRFYKEIVRRYDVPRAIGFDNQWRGSLRQQLGAFIFRSTLKRNIQKAFVPAERQKLFATHLGFSRAQIETGIYCCDYKLFNDYHQKFKSEKEINPPHRFLFVGRYESAKGVDALWQAFIEWKEETNSDWELWCLGKGTLEPVRHPAIKHFDFVQPDAMDEIIAGTSVFVLPSRFEPWGVVVHEFAAAGYPLLCSAQTGATEFFLEDEKNGFVIEGGNKDQIKEKLNTFSSMNAVQLNAMSQRSAQLAATITPPIWADRFMKLFEI